MFEARCRLKRFGFLSFLSVLVVFQSHCERCQRGGESSKPESGEATKKVYTIARTEAYRSLDPVKQFDESSSDLVLNVFDTLLTYHYLQRPIQLIPLLLEKIPEKVGEHQYQLKLRENIFFNDDPCFKDGKGRQLVADDVIYSLLRFADGNENNLSYSLMTGFILGLDQFHDQSVKQGKSFSYEQNPVAGIKKVDQYTILMTFERENPLALFPLAATQTSIVPKECVQHYGDQFAHHPVGSGPFYISQMDRRGTIVLSKNPRYFFQYPGSGEPGDAEKGLLVDANKTLPLVDEVRLPLIEEVQPGMLSFLKGEVDLVGLDRINFVKMAVKEGEGKFRLNKQYEGKFNIYTEPGLSCEKYIFNMKDPVLGGYMPEKRALRHAIAYALDDQGYIDLLMNGRAERLTSIVPTPIAGSQRQIPMPYFTFDKEMARRKLAEAGFPNGKGLPVLTIEYRAADSLTRSNFEFIRSHLADVGIKVKANFQTFSQWLQAVERGNFQITDAGWMADYPDAENFFQLLYSKNGPPGNNHGAFANTEYDELYLKTKFMDNGPERFEHFKKMNQIIFEQAPVVVSFNAYRVGLVHHWVSNMKRHILHFPPLRYINVDMKKKRESKAVE